MRARCPYSFQATLNMDGTALLLRCNNGRYKTKDTNQTAVIVVVVVLEKTSQMCLSTPGKPDDVH